MEIIRNSNPDVINFLGGFQKRVDEKTYRFNKFLVIDEYCDIVIIYNTYTGFIITLKKYEYNKVLNFEDSGILLNLFIENYCLVPEAFDENALVDSYRNSCALPITDTTLDRITGYTIFTTTKCNARCFYCYELGMKNKQNMTVETANKVADYIINASFHDDTVGLGWFGGEPLYNMEVIDVICNRMRESGKSFTGSMISNSYLFKDMSLVQKAVNDWNLKDIQVTIDGTEEIYNKTKKYIYKDDPSPFKSVIQAIHNLLQAGVGVSIRLNCDNHNVDDMMKVVTFLSDEFSGRGNISVYAWPLFEIGDNIRTPERRKELFEKMIELNTLLKECDLTFASDIMDGVQGRLCMADSGNSVTILPDGKVGICEHHILPEDMIGDIFTYPQKNWDIIKSYRNYVEPEPICLNCPLRPTCIKIKGCPSARVCDEYEKPYRIHRIKLQLKCFWFSHKLNNACRNTNQNCCIENG